MVPRENKNNAYAKFGRTNKEYYDIYRNGPWFVYRREWITRDLSSYAKTDSVHKHELNLRNEQS